MLLTSVLMVKKTSRGGECGLSYVLASSSERRVLKRVETTRLLWHVGLIAWHLRLQLRLKQQLVLLSLNFEHVYKEQMFMLKRLDRVTWLRKRSTYRQGSSVNAS